MSWRCRNSITGIGFLSVGFPSKKCSQQANTCLERDFLFKAFAHCNRIDSLEGVVCRLYGNIQEQSLCFCLCNSQKVCLHSFKDDHTYAKPLTDNQTTFTQIKIFCMDEKGVQVMTETDTMSAKGSIVTDCDSLFYTGLTKEICFTWRFKNIKLTDSFWKVFRFMSWRCRNSFTGIYPRSAFFLY
jgi:hypothetical protein